MAENYSLGSSDQEQRRLYLQREVYGDTLDFEFSPADVVYEFGCGVGATLWLAQAVPEGRYVGIDIQPEQISAARALAEYIDRCSKFLDNFRGLTESLVPELIARGDIIEKEWSHALKEAANVTPDIFITQMLRIAETTVV